MKTLFAVLIALLIFSGCSTKSTPYTKRKYQQNLLRKPRPQAEISFRQNKNSAIKEALYEEYQKWKGVKYCFGGTDKNGIDCSAFVQVIYRDALGVRVPRTTKEQAKRGNYVQKRALKEGDLVLFKTGYNSRHSGIYVEKGNFLHASSKHGVSISNLNNPYWRSKYWQSRRVIPQ